ncbi:MAG: TolC family protein [Cytophagaceae bacterium]
MLKNKLLLVIALSLINTVIAAQVLTYDSVRIVILTKNPELEMYRNQSKSMDAMAIGAKAWDAPQIGIGFFMTPYNTSYWSPRVMNIDGMNSMMPGMGNIMIQGRQMIPNPSRLNANAKYLSAASSVETEAGNAMANNLLFEAKKLYAQIQVLERKIEVLSEAEKILTIMISLGESKLAYNQEMLSSIYKAKSQKAIVQNERIMFENDKKQKMFYLNSIMNRNDRELFQVDTVMVFKEYENELVDTSLLISNRSDLKMIEKNLQVATLKQNAEKYKSRPDFGIEYGHMFAFGENPNQFTLMGMMSIPIAPWSSKMYRSNVTAYDYQMQAYRNQREAIMNESVGMIYGIKNELISIKYQKELYETMILTSLEKSYDLAFLAYQQNTGDLFVALDARMNLQMAQLQYEEVLLKLLLMQAEYEKQLQLL